MEAIQSSDSEPVPLTTAELLERRFIIFVIAHTNSFEEAATYLKMRVGALAERRHKYDIHTPPRRSYTGPHLTQEEMAAAFYASLAPAAPVASVTITPELLEAMVQSGQVTFTMLDGTAKTFLFSPMPPNPPNPPWRGGARMA